MFSLTVEEQAGRCSGQVGKEGREVAGANGRAPGAKEEGRRSAEGGAKYKQQYEETFNRLGFAERNLKKKDKEFERPQEEKNEIAKSKEKRVQTLDPRAKAVILKIVKTSEAATKSLEHYAKMGGNKKKDNAWNPPEDKARAQVIMNEVVANDYAIFPGDKDVFTTEDDTLFGKQDDGTFRTQILKDYIASTIIIKGEVSSFADPSFVPLNLVMDYHVRLFVFQGTR